MVAIVDQEDVYAFFLGRHWKEVWVARPRRDDDDSNEHGGEAKQNAYDASRSPSHDPHPGDIRRVASFRIITSGDARRHSGKPEVPGCVLSATKGRSSKGLARLRCPQP